MQTIFVFLAIIVALGVAFFQYLYKNKEKSQLKYWLSLLRFISIFGILILLINPSFKKTITESIKPNLIVAVDNSKSIKLNSKGDFTKSIVKNLKSNEILNNKYSIKYYGFGNGVYLLDSLKFNESQTNISAPVNEFSKLFKENNNPVILISDGNQTVGNSLDFINYKSPIYPIIIGDTTKFEDISIGQLNVNKYSYINNKLPVEVFINYFGNKSISKQFSVYNKSKRVFSKTIEFLKNENVKTESFYITAEEKGTQFFTAKIENLENELNVLNNKKSFSINVIEETSKILILSSIIHPDLGMLKKSIESNKQRSVSIKNISDFKGNISDFQLIILYQPSKDFETVMKEISTRKINNFVITGISTDWSFLNKVQNNYKKNTTSQTEEYYAVHNVNYPSFVLENINFSEFAPLEDNFGPIQFNVKANSLLYQKIGPITTEQALLATFKINDYKQGVLFGENIWRWRMNSFQENKTFEIFDGFIANLIQYLSSNLKNERLNVTVDPLFYANETVDILASYLDENFQIDTRTKLWVTISSKENNYIKKIPFALFKNQYKAEFSNIPSGEYIYSVTVDNQNSKSSGSFKVLSFHVEQQFKNSNDESLKKLAANSNGKIYYENDVDKLISNLQSNNSFKSIQKSKVIETPLIDWEWILGIILLSLSLEWFTRKYFGKI
ncbi:VWA domain-containing protein [Lutibacter citreus]|uniref:VWA domain-containing protein n=1 Tax=Lutibacter citreus TaxID=2138210 RepID=UPI000DBE82B3|nr:VWA domain-containing protein [Lutibacter citreus]